MHGFPPRHGDALTGENTRNTCRCTQRDLIHRGVSDASASGSSSGGGSSSSNSGAGGGSGDRGGIGGGGGGGSGGTMCGVGGGCDRPVVWLATSNHMMCERNVNSDGAFPNGWKAWTLEDYDP